MRCLETMIWDVIKQSAADIWDEMLYLMIFNVIWLIGTLLIIPWPFVTFGIFAVAYDIGQNKGIKFTTFFSHARRVWKQAYIWGGINLGLLIVLLVNINFYGNIRAQWAEIAQILIIGFTLFWGILQLVALPIYPRLEEPGFKLAMRNAVVVMGRYPLATLSLIAVVVVIGVISYFFQIIILLGAFSIITIVANRMVGAIIKRELKRGTEG